MKGYNKWSYEQFNVATDKTDADTPYICRLIPCETGVTVETKDKLEGILYIKKRQGGEWQTEKFLGNRASVSGLCENCEYQLYIENNIGKKSAVRLFKTGCIIGTPVIYHHPDDDSYAFSGRFFGTPSLLRLPNGALLASCDLFDWQTPQNLTRIFRSEDDGKTWKYLCELMPCFWGKLFWHNGAVYMLACSTEYGDLLIGKSDDEGVTWTTPTVILRGQHTLGNGWHKSACEILKKDGRMFVSMEFGSRAFEGFYNTVISVSENSDLLDAGNWTIAELYKQEGMDGIEGNVTEAPNGDILNILRYRENEAIVTRLSNDYEKLEFVKTIPFPLAHTKFQISRHCSGRYYAMGNTPPMRNVLAIYKSDDLENWEFVKNVVDCSNCDDRITGFQYPAFILEGDDMLILSRTAYNGADNFHNSNYITFHKISIKE